MADGTTKPISEIEPGDEVWVQNPGTGEAGAREVLATWPHQDTLLEFSVEGGSVTTTEDHHFWNVTDDEWQEAQHIGPGDHLLTADGHVVEAGNLDWSTAHYADAYDLTIENIHTYFASVGDEQVLVHNCGEMLSRPSQIAERLGVTTREVNDAIHALKTDLPRGGPVRNPDVVVDAVSGEVFPQLPGGGIGGSIGNIFDELPGAG